jgi:hypothetical protein
MSPMMWWVGEEGDLFPNFIIDNFIFNPNWNGSKLIQKGEGDRTGSRETLCCLFFLVWLILTGFLC